MNSARRSISDHREEEWTLDTGIVLYARKKARGWLSGTEVVKLLRTTASFDLELPELGSRFPGWRVWGATPKLTLALCEDQVTRVDWPKKTSAMDIR